MTTAFETIWKLHRQGSLRGDRPHDFRGDRPREKRCLVPGAWCFGKGGVGSDGDRPRGSGSEGDRPRVFPFDEIVEPGQIRIFADTEQPFPALIAESRGLLGWRLVPLSPFPIPASAREFAAEGHVFQLWNTCTASCVFVSRSWLVGTVPAKIQAEIVAAIPSASPGRLTAGDSVQAQYEREFLWGQSPEFWGLSPKKRGIMWRIVTETCKIAASAVVCIGVFYFVMGEGRERLRAWPEGGYQVQVKAEDAAVELAEVAEQVEESPELKIAEKGDILDEFATETLISSGTVPKIPGTVPMIAGTVPMISPTISQMRFRPIHVPGSDGFTDPHVRPLSVLALGTDPVLASVSGRGAMSRRTGPVLASPPRVVCRVAASPWNPPALLVNITAPVVEGGLIEVFFDKTVVQGYRFVSGGETRPMNAYYEILPRTGVTDFTAFGQVTVRYPTAHGEVRQIEPIRQAEISEMDHPPAPPAHPGAPSVPLAVPDDIPVEVTL